MKTTPFGVENPLDLFGITFVYDPSKERYQLTDKYYDLKDLIFIIEDFFMSMYSINERGYVTDRVLSLRFMNKINTHLTLFGYESGVLGNNETTYTM